MCMIQEFVDKFLAKEKEVKESFSSSMPGSYAAILKVIVETINPDDTFESLDVDRIHTIDDGDYQGTILFVVGATGYQPSRYWYTKVSYGSCSGCDTLQSITDYVTDGATKEQLNDLWTLALHMVQNMREI